jgi:S-adenosylmethionine:tRNA ribosyltransferase-isomerase
MDQLNRRNMDPREIRIESYDYVLPADRIATHPLPVRDDARLLVYRGGIIAEDIYRNAGRYLPEDALMVFNDTRVLSARIPFRKPSGGAIEVFLLGPAAEKPGGMAELLTTTGQAECVCMVGGVSKWKPGQVLERSFGTDADIRLYASLLGKTVDGYLIRFEWSPADRYFSEILSLAGEVPLPPYLNRMAEKEDRTRYQTVYAREEGSVAAPTAGLHFTEDVFADLDRRGIGRGFVTLHVGAGTFRPVKAERMSDHVMHEEFLDVSKALIMRLRTHPGPVYAVGTTSLRTLESLYWMGRRIILEGVANQDIMHEVGQWEPYDQLAEGHPEPDRSAALDALIEWMNINGKDRILTKTGLLIAPGYRFRMVEGLFTNFHQPSSTLLLLVAAMAGPGWRDIYEHALANGYRFLSYGDGSLIHRQEP